MNEIVKTYSVKAKIKLTLPQGTENPVNRRIQEAINQHLVDSMPRCAAWFLWVASNRWERHPDDTYFVATARFGAFGTRSYEEGQKSPGLESIQQEFDRIIPGPVRLASGYVLHPVKVRRIIFKLDSVGDYWNWLDLVSPSLESNRLIALAPDITQRLRHDIHEMRHGPVETEEYRQMATELDANLKQQMDEANKRPPLGEQQ